MADNKNDILIKIKIEENRALRSLTKVKESVQKLDRRTREYKEAVAEQVRLETKLNSLRKQRIAINNKVETSVKKLTKVQKEGKTAAGASTSATLELGRVLSDMPYGIRGVANNLQQLASNLFFMSKATDAATGKTVGFMGAVGSLFRGLAGPAGLLIAFQGVIALLDYFKVGMGKSKDETVDAEKATKDFSSELKSLEKTLSDSGVSQENYNQKIRDYILLKKQQIALDKELLSTQSEIDKKNEEINATTEDDIKLNERLEKARKNAADQAKIIYPDTREGRQAKAQATDYSITIEQIESRLRNNISHRKKLEEDIVQLHADALKKIKEIDEAKNKLGAAEEGTLKALKDQRKELEKTRELEAKTPEEYKKQSIAIDKITKQIEYIEGLKKKGSATKKLSPFATPKELDIDIKNAENAIIQYEKQIKESRLKEELNDKLSQADTEEEKKKIREQYQLDRLKNQLDSEQKVLELKLSTEKAVVKAKTKDHVDELKRKYTEFITELGYKEKLKKISKEDADKLRGEATGTLFDSVVQANNEEVKSIEEVESKYESLMKLFEKLGIARKDALISGFGAGGKKDDSLTGMEEFAEKFNAISSSVTDFMNGEFDRQMTIEQNKTNALNNELRERLNNESLSAEERKNIQLQIARNDEELRKKQEKIEKKRFRMNKAAQIAGALVNTAAAAAGVMADAKGGFFTRLAQALPTIAFGLGQVAIIARQKFQSSAGATTPAGALGGGGSGGGDNTREFNFNLAGSTQSNQLTQSIAGQLSQPIQTYVVSSEITSQQQLDLNIANTATIGG